VHAVCCGKSLGKPACNGLCPQANQLIIAALVQPGDHVVVMEPAYRQVTSQSASQTQGMLQFYFGRHRTRVARSVCASVAASRPGCIWTRYALSIV
jgi:hypothetical protein